MDGKILPRHIHYARKSPCREHSALLSSGPGGGRRLLDSRHAQPWGRPGAGPNRHLVRLEHYIAYYVEQTVWGPNDTLESDTARTSTLRLQLRTWIPHAPGKWGLAPDEGPARKAGNTRTDNQRRAMPHAIRVDVVIPQ